MGRWKDKYVIGLTGNIGMGKSVVRTMLQQLGAFTLDADDLAHRVMAPNAPAYRPVIEMFGKFVLDAQGQIDRNKLGAVVFSHAAALQALENITHPIIMGAIDNIFERSKHKVIVLEAIKLIETDLANQVDTIWVVDTPPQVQLQRLMKRGLSQADAVKRMTLQNPQQDKLARANVVIKNEGTPAQTWAQVQQAWSSIAQSKADAAAAEQVVTVKVTPQPAPAAPAGAPAPAAAPAANQMQIDTVAIKRPRPADFGKISQLMKIATGRDVSSDDIMQKFGEKTYMMAEANNTAVGVIAFLVENLVTRVDEFVIHPQAPAQAVGKALVDAMENASNDLHSEVAFIFLPNKSLDQKPIFMGAGYEEAKVEEIRIPAWREAITEGRPADTTVLSKRLREKLVLKPI